MLAEVLVWKEMVILLGLKNGEGKITVAGMIAGRISNFAHTHIYIYITCTNICVILYRCS